MSEESEKKEKRDYKRDRMSKEELDRAIKKGEDITKIWYGNDRLYPGGPKIGPGGRFGPMK